MTTPLDVVKTRLQTEGVSSAKRYSGSAVVRGRARASIVVLMGLHSARTHTDRICAYTYMVYARTRTHTRSRTHGMLTAAAARPRAPHAQLPALRRIVAEEGWRTLWHGLQPRVLFHAPSAAVCWGTYETMKAVLRDA